MHSLIIFASGKGSNAQAIIDYFKSSALAKVSLIVSNKENAGVLHIANKEQIENAVISRQEFHADTFVNLLRSHNPSLLVLAGFLWKVPDSIIAAFRNRIINIHPALLPQFGGKGMYGHNVHAAVIDAGKKESGITIHYVDEVYDNGDIILQARCKVSDTDDADTLARRVHALEHFYFPRTIEFLLKYPL